MATKSIFWLATDKSTNSDAPSTNTQCGDTDTSYGVRLTTGQANKLVIDVCFNSAIKANPPAFFRVRCDVADDNIITNNRSYVTDFFSRADCSDVTGDILTTSANEGRAISTMADMPFLFRRLGATGFRVVFKKDGVVANGQAVNVYLDSSSTSTAADFDIDTDADIKFNQKTDTFPFSRVNGGPSGTGLNAGIPPFTASLTRTAGAANATKGDFHIFSSKPFFASGGEGIALKTARFRLSEYIQGSVGSETYYTLTKPTTPEVKGADNLYKYTVKTGITDGASKAYLVTCTRISDAFDVTANVQQTPVGNEPILVENKAARIGNNFTIVGKSLAGGNLNVKFKGNNAPEGFTTIKRYSVYYLTKQQASDICANRATPTTNFLLKFPLVKAKAESLGQVKHLEAADISYTAYDAIQETTISGLNNTDASNNMSMYSVYVTASTQKDGQFVEGVGPADLNYTALKPATGADPARNADTSMGAYVYGAPGAPIAGTIVVGKDISANTDNNNDAADASMVNHFKLLLNDYNVTMRGDNYTNLRYAIIKSNQVQYANGEFTKDASFATVPLAYDGTATITEKILRAANDASGVEYNYANSKWNSMANKAIVPGTSYSIKYAFENGAGIGEKTAWLPFTPSTMPDAQDSLFSADPSNGISASYFGKVLVSSTNFQLKQSEVTTDVLAARQGLVVDDNSISAGWSQKTKNQIKNNLDASVNLTGGSPITGARYAVREISESIALIKNYRLYGNTSKGIDATKSRIPRTSTKTDGLTVSSYIDVSDQASPLRMGQRYDISFALVNKNGYNDGSNCIINGFAPMGSIKAMTGLSQATAAPKMGSTAGTVTVDLCFNDISGQAQHGGHQLTHYDIKVEQLVNGNNTVLKDWSSDGSANTKYIIAGADATGIATTSTATALRNAAFTTAASDASGVAGYPLKVSMRGVAKARTAGNSGTAVEQNNLLYNKNRASVYGAVSTVNLPGPLINGTAHDEVRSLKVVGGDANLTVTFAEPENAAVKNNNLPAPVVRYYDIYAYDMSLNASAQPQNIAHGRHHRQLAVTEREADSTYKTVLTGDSIINGGAYMVVVHTRWGYGPNQSLDFTTAGIYSTDPTQGLSTIIAVEKATGWQWYQASDPLGQGTAVSAVAKASLVKDKPLCSDLAELAVCSKKPEIQSNKLEKSLIVRDNGATLTNGLLLQLSPITGTAAPNVFSLDLTSANQSTIVRDKRDSSRYIVSRTYTVKSATLGANWVNEQNIVIAANSQGAAYKVIL